MSQPVRIDLADRKTDLVACWRTEFLGSPDVEVVSGNLFELEAEAVVSPANSFGNMDGGLDGRLLSFFGKAIEDKVRTRIREDFDGELLVGQAFATATGNPRFPHLITAPTMRVPQDVSGTVNAFLAMTALLRCTVSHGFASVVVPGLCSMTGGMPPEIVARQMKAGFDRVLRGAFDGFSHWAEHRYLELYLVGKTDSL